MTAPVVCVAGSGVTDLPATPEAAPCSTPQRAQGPDATETRPPTGTPRLGHRPALDGLRGIAILGVIGVHVALLPGGGAGVDVFFTLSGFLITSLLLEEHAETGRLRLKQFYMRRFLRLVPAFTLLLLVHFVYCLVCYRGWQQKAGLAGGVISLGYFSNWSRAYKWIPHFGLSHTWSLAIEEQFYLLWPVLLLAVLFLFKSQGGRLRAVAALALAFVLYRALLIQWGAPFHRIYNGLDTRADALLIGCLTSFIYKTYPIKSESRSAWLLGAAACLSLLLLLGHFALAQSDDSPSWYCGGFTLLSVGSALVILGLMSEPPGWRILTRLLKVRW